MASTDFTDNSTVILAAWLDDVDVATYSSLSSVAGTNAITATGPVPMSAYASGQMFRFIPANTNTGATTINITPSGGSALGAKNIFFNGAACAGGEIRQNQPCIIVYDGTQFNLIGPFAGGTVAGATTFSARVTLASFAGMSTQTETGATATLSATSFAVTCNRAGTVTLTLPDPAGVNSGRVLLIRTIQAQQVDSASANVTPNNSDTPGTAILPATDGASVMLVSDGTNWVSFLYSV